MSRKLFSSFISQITRQKASEISETDQEWQDPFEPIASVEEGVGQRIMELHVLHELSEAMSRAISNEELCRLVLHHLPNAIDYDIGALAFAESGTWRLLMKPERMVAPVLLEELGTRFSSDLAVLSKKSFDEVKPPIQLLDARSTLSPAPVINNLGSILQVPVTVGADREPIGALFIGSERTEAFNEHHENLIRTIANQLAAVSRTLHAPQSVEHRQLAALVQSFPDGMLLIDSEGHLLLCNPVARSYLDILTDKSSPGLIHSLGGQPLKKLLGPPSKGMPYHEIEVTSPENRVFEVEARQLSIGLEPEAWGMSVRDVTHKRQLEIRAQQQARLAAVGQLASGIAHDFNNLLMGIIGFSQLLQLRAGMSDSAKADLERIVELGQRAANLVRQILDFSRKSISKRSPFDLAVFLKETTKFLQRTIQENITISLKFAPGEYLLDADPSQLQQVFTNLALNSRDAMPSGGELIINLSRFCLRPGESKPYSLLQHGDWLLISVSDTGCGIPPDVITHVFEPFYTTKEVGKGTGLGMAQAYGIVKQHDGFIFVESQVNQGTTVNIYLPALAPPAEKPRKSVGSLLPRGHGESIMFVEDEPDVLEMGKQMLESIGYRVIAATNGHEALRVYEHHMNDIALIVCDYVMPEMGGLELVQEVQRKNPAARFIMLSGYSLEGTAEILNTKGVVACMQKPVSLTQMAEAIHRALSEPR